MAAWPIVTGRGQYAQAAGSIETPPNTIIRTEMDAGPAKLRQKYTAAPRFVQVRVILTKAEVATFDTWYMDTIHGGADAFTWLWPRRTGEADEEQSMRFVGVPQYRTILGGNKKWELSATLEILP